MPAQVADWEQIKATAIACGSLKEAAALHGVSHESIRVRAHREKWPTGRRVHAQAKAAKAASEAQIVRSSGVTSVTSTADALSKRLSEDSDCVRLNALRMARNTTQFAADLSEEHPEKVMEMAQDIKAVAQTAALAGGWQQTGPSTVVQVNVLNMGAEQWVSE